MERGILITPAFCTTSHFLGGVKTSGLFLAPAVTVGETEGAMDPTSVFFWPLLLPITL